MPGSNRSTVTKSVGSKSQQKRRAPVAPSALAAAEAKNQVIPNSYAGLALDNRALELRIRILFRWRRTFGELHRSSVEEDAPSINRMYTDIEWALSQGLPPGELIPMVERLVNEAPANSPHASYAKRQLAELIVRREPFRAARLAREVLARNSDDDRAHAALGLASMLMGHFRMAENCYRAALRLVPHCPWYAHNLGHLLDVAMSRPHEALPWLKMSRRALPQEPEIASSYAHALLGAGQPDASWEHLLAAVEDDHDRAREITEGWAASLEKAPPKGHPARG